MRFTRSITLLLALGAVALSAAPAVAQEAGTLLRPDVIYVPTPPEVVSAMAVIRSEYEAKIERLHQRLKELSAPLPATAAKPPDGRSGFFRR